MSQHLSDRELMQTREDIIRMAREANIGTYINLDSHLVGNHLERFAALVAAAEREACAQIAETAEPYQAADLIRARAAMLFDDWDGGFPYKGQK